jgi:hypothetical protein
VGYIHVAQNAGHQQALVNFIQFSVFLNGGEFLYVMGYNQLLKNVCSMKLDIYSSRQEKI